MSLTPAQCRAARALLAWTQDHLAERAAVSRGTIRGFETGQHALQRATAAAIRRAFEAAGIALLAADAMGGAGVRFADAQHPRAAPPPDPLAAAESSGRSVG